MPGIDSAAAPSDCGASCKERCVRPTNRPTHAGITLAFPVSIFTMAAMKISPLIAVLFAFMSNPGGVALTGHLLPAAELASASTAPASGRPYLVIPETTSPDGQYAVVWALPKGPQIDWEKFRTGERKSDELPSFADPKSEIEDNLIELKSGRKLATVSSGYWALPEGDYSSGLEYRTNEEWMEVAWSPQSDFVLVLHHLRTGPAWGSLRGFQIEAGVVVSQLECGPDLEAALVAHLKKRHRQEYERGKDHLGPRFNDVKSLGGLKFSVNGVAKLVSKSGNGIYRGATIKFELRRGEKGRLSLHLLGFTELDLNEAS